MKVQVLKQGELVVSVVPAVGGRVQQVAFEGVPLLTSADVHPDNWGSTYWTSPQAAWGWPPVAAIDSAPFEEVPGPTLTLQGPHAALGGTEVRLTKIYQLATSPRARFEIIDFGYRLENVGKGALSVAGWEISRVPAGGITFYPAGDSVLTPIEPHAALVPERVRHLAYFDHRTFVPGLNRKVHADAKGGYLAHVLPQSGGALLLLKLYADTLPAEQAPGEGEVELFANEDGRYVEVEVQGPYERILPGESSEFRVRWVIGRIPPTIDIADWDALTVFVEGLVQDCHFSLSGHG